MEALTFIFGTLSLCQFCEVKAGNTLSLLPGFTKTFAIGGTVSSGSLHFLTILINFIFSHGSFSKAPKRTKCTNVSKGIWRNKSELHLFEQLLLIVKISVFQV
jgi:hypothetical protein